MPPPSRSPQKESFELHLEWGTGEDDGGGDAAAVAAAALLFPRRAFVNSSQVCWRLTCSPQAPHPEAVHQVSTPPWLCLVHTVTQCAHDMLPNLRPHSLILPQTPILPPQMQCARYPFREPELLRTRAPK